ncbi:MAG: DUF4271 domain-containing protein [Chitinophagaceae bacterium]|nr:MAG: DUF4271 domain-containing protein [Chitinophagaceae bacterium]
MTPISTSGNQKFILVLCLFSNAMMERLFLLPVRVFLILGFLFLSFAGKTQSIDSLRRIDSLRGTDSVLIDTAVVFVPPKRDTIKIALQFPFASDSFRFRKRLFYSFTDPVRYTISEKSWSGKDVVFYSVIALLLFFALIRNSFSRYIADLFSSYFRTTVRQRQIKEQLLQSPLPSLLFNIFFVISTAVFLSLLFEHFGLAAQLPFWLLVVYSAIAVTVIYGGKFLLLKFFGWVFQQSDATDTYIFVIFSTNKILGISLLPFTILLAFTYGAVNAAAVTLSIIVIGGLFMYSFFLSYISLNQTININFFHFLLYLTAFEIVPVLLINKLLFTILREIS